MLALEQEAEAKAVMQVRVHVLGSPMQAARRGKSGVTTVVRVVKNQLEVRNPTR